MAWFPVCPSVKDIGRSPSDPERIELRDLVRKAGAEPNRHSLRRKLIEHLRQPSFFGRHHRWTLSP